MDDLLREALDALRSIGTPQHYEYRKIADLIARIQQRLDTGGWIPVAKRLPEDGVEVLLLHDKVCRTVGFRKGNRYSSDDGVYPICNVVAWQSLPDLPKEK